MMRLFCVISLVFCISVAGSVKVAHGLTVPSRVSVMPTDGAWPQDSAVMAPGLVDQHSHPFSLPYFNVPRLRVGMRNDRPYTAKVGFVRPVRQLGDPRRLARKLHWKPDGRGGGVARLAIRSPMARALRLAIVAEGLPDSAVLDFYGEKAGHHRVKGSEINRLIRLNRASGAVKDLAKAYWSPVVEGQRLAVDLHLPYGTDPGSVQLALPALSHQTSLPGRQESRSGVATLYTKAINTFGLHASGACNIDVNCKPDWSATSKAVARMIFTSGSGTYVCSGTLLNDSQNSGTPWFLTASHCIGTQTEASSVVTYWFYDTYACGATRLNPELQTLGPGATLLYTSPGPKLNPTQSQATDATLLQLDGTPPMGVTYAGWSTEQPQGLLAAAVSGIHHPVGDMAKISHGVIKSLTRWGMGQQPNDHPPVDLANPVFTDVLFSEGTTEDGSSGSGLFLDDGQYLLGQLWGGDSDCSNLSGHNYYGLFSVSYKQGRFSQWLDPSGEKSLQGFTDSGYQLRIDTSGLGEVLTPDKSLSCTSACSQFYRTGTVIQLIAQPSPGYLFAGWTGDCGGAGTCELNVNQMRRVQARFVRSRMLTIRIPSGGGAVTSIPAGIDCRQPVCQGQFSIGQRVELNASADAGYRFKVWAGACVGSGLRCRLSLATNKAVRVSFLRKKP